MEKTIQKALYRGPLNVGNIELNCYVLEDGTRILSSTSIFKAFDRPRKGRRSKEERRYFEQKELPSFLPINILETYKKYALLPENAQKSAILTDIDDILEWIIPVQFYDGGKLKAGYKSNLLVKMCELYVRANEIDGILRDNQKQFAEKAQILLYAFASVGLDGLIDEATGHNKDPKYQGLRVLLNQYIEERLQRWTMVFPDQFFAYLDKLYGNEKTISRNRPQYYGHFINRYIYDQIEKGVVKEELDRLNIKEDGTRKGRFHQWLKDFGKNQLILQIGQIMGVMQVSSNKRSFEEKIERSNSLQVSIFTDEEWEAFKLIGQGINTVS